MLVLGILAPGATAAKKKAAGPQVVGTDDAADWGVNADPTLNPLGGPLGQELVEASIGMADPKTINFIIKVAGLPPSGGVPEASRYNWDFTVNGNAYQLTGAFTDYLRGVCNPLHTGACPPPQDPGQQPFFLRQGPCNVGADCFLLGTFQATFDPAEGTITIPVPLAAIKAKPGSKIGPGVSTIGGTVYAAPAAMVTYADLPNDTMTVLKTFVVPK
jgi:hypothetical protein